MVHHYDNSEIVTLEEDLAKQTRKVQNLKANVSTSSEELQFEKEMLRMLQDDLARAMRRTLRGPNRGMSRWLTQTPTGAGDAGGGGSMGRRITQAVRKQLFNQQGQLCHSYSLQLS